ncbi:unnamed protein product [Haemonchus placei]|uniref:Tox-ART-HYD1 domain-containing protein n=1 Tax=Haemonchus placei TaxID=6290 RepID=A0A0N4WM30_HAEPC|nr:unnamed protein product [Haemonchus placei]
MNQQEFTVIRGERYDLKKPKDSGILRGDGSFTDKTMNHLEFVVTKGERYDVRRPEDSDVLKGTGLFREMTMYQKDYSSGNGKQRSRSLNRELSNLRTDSAGSKLVEKKTISSTTQFRNGKDSRLFQILRDDGHAACKELGYAGPSSAQLFKDFSYRPVLCPAGELLKSIRVNHSDTSHFHFEKYDKGHHYYRSRSNEH